jgi:hypothetical protein
MTHLFESGEFDKPIIESIVFIIFENITLLIKVHTNLNNLLNISRRPDSNKNSNIVIFKLSRFKKDLFYRKS